MFVKWWLLKFRFTILLFFIFTAGDQCLSGGDPDSVDDWHRSKGQTVQQHPRQRGGHMFSPRSNGDQTVHGEHWRNCQGQGSGVKVLKNMSILIWKYIYSFTLISYPKCHIYAVSPVASIWYWKVSFAIKINLCLSVFRSGILMAIHCFCFVNYSDDVCFLVIGLKF